MPKLLALGQMPPVLLTFTHFHHLLAEKQVSPVVPFRLKRHCTFAGIVLQGNIQVSLNTLGNFSPLPWEEAQRPVTVADAGTQAKTTINQAAC